MFYVVFFLQPRSAVEAKLHAGFKDIAHSVFSFDRNLKYSEKELAQVSRGIEEGLKHVSTRPSTVVTNLSLSLNHMLDRLYGIDLEIPKKCLKL